MARKTSKTLTAGELRIMKVIWQLKQASVKEVVEHLNRSENLAYNTVQTMMNILTEKGYLEHTKQGRSYLYRPIVSRQASGAHALKELLFNFFDDSPHTLVVNLLDNEQLDAIEIQKIKEIIRKADEEESDD